MATPKKQKRDRLHVVLMYGRDLEGAQMVLATDVPAVVRAAQREIERTITADLRRRCVEWRLA